MYKMQCTTFLFGGIIFVVVVIADANKTRVKYRQSLNYQRYFSTCKFHTCKFPRVKATLQIIIGPVNLFIN